MRALTYVALGIYVCTDAFHELGVVSTGGSLGSEVGGIGGRMTKLFAAAPSPKSKIRCRASFRVRKLQH